MNYFFIILFALGVIVCDDDPCTFAQGTTVETAEFLKCLRSRAFDQTEADKTISTILAYLEIVPYRDTLLNPPTGYEELKTDFLEELEKLRTGTYDNQYAFDVAVQDYIGLHGFSNMRYSGSCAERVTAVQPYSIKMTADDESSVISEVKLSFEEYNHTLAQIFQEKYKVDLKDKVITHITAPEGELEDKEESPAETIDRWGAKYFPFILSRGTRFEFALYYFVFRSNYVASTPESCKYKYKDGEEEKEVTVPFFVITPSMKSFQEFCPPSESKTTSAISKEMASTLSPVASSTSPLLINTTRSSSFTRLHRTTSRSTSASNDDDDIVEMLPHSLNTACYIKSLKTTYVNLGAYRAEYGYDLFRTLGHMTDEMKQNKIVIDMRGTNSYTLSFLTALFRLLFNTEFPSSRPMGYVQSEATDKMASYLFTPFRVDIFNTLQTTDPLKITEISTEERQERTGEGVKPRTFRTPFIINTERDFDNYVTEIPDHSPKAWAVDPVNTIVLTDRTPPNFVASFLRRIQEKHLAKVVVVGRIPSLPSIAPDTDPISLFSIATDGTDISINSEIGSALLGFASFPLSGQALQIPFTESYTDGKDTFANLRTAFKEVHPDFVIPPVATEDNEEVPKNLLTNVVKLFDKHASWEVQLHDDCQATDRDENAYYGYPAKEDGTGFDESKCERARCKDDFYLGPEDKCIKRPVTPAIDACDYEFFEMGLAQTAIECLSRLQFVGDTRDEKTIPIVLKWLESYAYRDTMLNPPMPFQEDAIDVVKALEDIGKTEYATAFEFQSAITDVFVKLRDPHTFYYAPCSSAQVFALPVTFGITEDENKKMVVSMQPTQNELFLKVWLDHRLGIDHFDTVTHIHFPELDGDEDKTDEDPYDTLVRWAVKFNPDSRTPSARLNYALQTYFQMSPYSLTPKGDVIVKGKMKDSDVELEAHIPWAVLKATTSTNILEEKCPITKQEENVCEITEYVGLSSSEEDDNAYFDRVAAKYKSDPITLRLTEAIRKNPKLWHQIRREIRTYHKTQKPDLSSLLRSRSSRPDSLPLREDNDLTLIDSVEGDIYAWYSQSKATVYLSVVTFAPNEHDLFHFVAVAIKAVETYLEKGCKKLVVDVRGNGGGYVVLGTALLHVLFPQDWPKISALRVVASDINQEVFDLASEEDGYLQWDTLEKINKFSELHTFELTEGNETTTRSRTWAGTFSFDFTEVVDEINDNLPDSLKNGYYISPQEVVIVSDGECGSTCAQFTKRALQHNLAKAIGFGASEINGIPFDMASFAAGNVMDIDLAYELKVPSAPEHFPYKDVTMRYTQTDSFSSNWTLLNETLEFQIVHPDAVVPIFSSAPFSPDSSSDVLQLLETVDPVFNKCYHWEVQEADCKPQFTPYPEHTLFGHPCDPRTEKFDTLQCVPLRCEKGYYKSPYNGCIPIPPLHPQPTPPKPDPDPGKPTETPTKVFNALTVVLLVLVIVLFVISIILLVFCCLSRRSGKAQSNDAFYKFTE